MMNGGVNKNPLMSYLSEISANWKFKSIYRNKEIKPNNYDNGYWEFHDAV